ncbi:MAG: HEPN domain-containing protein [Candidatus Heimdallarchaeota archaeon]
MEVPREASDEGLTPWIQQLGSEAEAERLRAQAALVKQGQAAVLPLIAAYAGVTDVQVKERIVALLGLIGGDAVDALIQQLVERNPGRQECARQALPRIVASLPTLLALPKTHPNLNSVAQAILHELAANLGYPSLDQLLTDYKSLTQQTKPLTSTQLRYELRVKRVLEVLEEARECFNSDLYSQTILTCDWVIQQLLTAILEFFHRDLGNDANKLPIVISTLRNIGVRIRAEKELRWLRILRNDLRYELKRPTKREANQALRVARYFTQEVKGLLSLRF